MRFIKVSIECHKNQDEPDYEELGIKVDPETEYREGYIRVDQVISFYPYHHGRGTLIHLAVNDTIYVSESIKEIAQLMQENGAVISSTRKEDRIAQP